MTLYDVYIKKLKEMKTSGQITPDEYKRFKKAADELIETNESNWVDRLFKRKN
jgi:major membrane immunogen (membrane-anchored lipoprotein)